MRRETKRVNRIENLNLFEGGIRHGVLRCGGRKKISIDKSVKSIRDARD